MILFFLLLALLFGFDHVLFGPWAFVRFHDVFNSGFFEYFNRGRLLLEHGFFNWYPNFAGGMPSFVFHHPPYYLLCLLSMFLPLWLIYALLRVGLMMLAGYGMYRLLHDYWQVSRPWAVLGGLFFTLSSSLYVVHVLFIYVFPAFFVWWLDLQQNLLSFLGKAGRLLGLLVLTLLSYPVITLPFYPVLHLALVVCFFRQSDRFPRLVINTVLVWTAYVLFFVPSIYALYDYIPLAQRTFNYDIYFVYKSFFPAVRSLVGNFFYYSLTEPTLLLIIYGLPLLTRASRLRQAALLYFLFNFISAFFASDFAGLFTDTFIIKMDLSHFVFASHVCAPLTAILALEKTAGSPLSIRRTLALLAFILIFPKYIMLKLTGIHPPDKNIILLSATCFLVGLSFHAILRLPGYLHSAASSFSSLPGKVRFAYVVFALSLVASAIIVKSQYVYKDNYPYSLPYAKWFTTNEELQRLAVESRSQVFRVGCVDLHPAVAESYGLELASEQGALFSRYYKDFIRVLTAPQLQNPENKARFESWYVLFLSLQETWDQPHAVSEWNMPLLLMLNVKYLIALKPIAGIEAYADQQRHVANPGITFGPLKDSRLNDFLRLPLWIYRLRDTFPRAFVATRPVILPERRDVLEELSRQTVDDLRRKVFLFAGDLPASANFADAVTPADDAPGAVEIVEYAPARIVLRGKTASPAFLVISNNFEPKWRARVNDRPTPVFRANHAFQAVYLEQPGPFRVELEFRNPVLDWLHLFYLPGLFLLVLSASQGRRPPSPPGPLAADLPAGDVITPEADPVVSRRVDHYWVIGLTGLLLAAFWGGYCFRAAGWRFTNEYDVYFSLVAPVAGILIGLWGSLIKGLEP